MIKQITNSVDITAQTKARINEWLARSVVEAGKLDPTYQQLWEVITRQVLPGGKMLRPLLTVAAYEGYGGTSRAIYDLAAAQEFLHVSLLVHDDIMDNDYLRHGRPNVAGEYLQIHQDRPQTEHLAMSAALLAGDLLLARAHEAIVHSGFEDRQKMAAMQVLSRQVFEVAAGQQLDVESDFLASAGPEQSLKVTKLKTASYSFVGPLLMGAQVAGAPEAAVLHLETLGTALGIAYQLADDLLGVYGDEAVLGKSVLSDIRSGKSTYMMRLALELTGADERNWFLEHWGRSDAGLEELDRVKTMLDACGAKEQAVTKMEAYAHEARAALAAAGLRSDSAELIGSVIDKAVKRQA